MSPNNLATSVKTACFSSSNKSSKIWLWYFLTSWIEACNEADLLKITTADGVLHTFSKQNSSFNIQSGTPFYWGDLYGSIFSPAFFEYDWSTPEKSIYKMQVNNEHFVIQPTLFEDYKALASEIIEVAKVCKAITH